MAGTPRCAPLRKCERMVGANGAENLDNVDSGISAC